MEKCNRLFNDSKNLSFVNAVQTVLGNMKIQAPVKYEQEEKNHERRLKIPVKASNNARAINYLLESRNRQRNYTILH